VIQLLLFYPFWLDAIKHNSFTLSCCLQENNTLIPLDTFLPQIDSHDLLQLFGLRELLFHNSQFPPECFLPEYTYCCCVSLLDIMICIFSLSSLWNFGRSFVNNLSLPFFQISISIDTCLLQLNGHDELWLFRLWEFSLPPCDFPPKYVSSKVLDLSTHVLWDERPRSNSTLWKFTLHTTTLQDYPSKCSSSKVMNIPPHVLLTQRSGFVPPFRLWFFLCCTTPSSWIYYSMKWTIRWHVSSYGSMVHIDSGFVTSDLGISLK